MAVGQAGEGKRARVVFQPSGRRGWVPLGMTILDAARLLGVGIEALCSGCQACGKCKVKIVDGVFDQEEIESSVCHSSPASGEELECLSREEMASGYRLACAAAVAGELVVFVPRGSESIEQMVRKEASEVALELDPAVKAIAGTIPAAAGGDDRVARRLRGARFPGGPKPCELYFHESVLGEHAGQLEPRPVEATFIVADPAEVIRVDPGSAGRRRLLGIAVDLGTTTVAGLLCDLETGELVAHQSMMNPQIELGEDVLSRITYAGSGAGNRIALAAAAHDAFNTILRETSRIARCDPVEIVEMTVVGNPTMHHLALGLDPAPLGRTPYRPLLTAPVSLYASVLQLEMLPCGKVHFLPLRAGFVGADTIAGILACDLATRAGVTLFVDVGTNGEIVLGTPRGLFAAACATGPAFEGAHISCGMRAAQGAIERVRMDPQTWEVEVKVIGAAHWGRAGGVAPRGVCGSGIIDAVAELFRCGVLTPSGAFTKDRGHRRLVGSGASRAFVLIDASESATGEALAITAKDVRAVQVGKAALYAGARLLMARAGVERVDRVLLAGAFGSYIDPVSALRLGMLPDCPVEDVLAVGNAAGDGARKALLDRGARMEAVRLKEDLGYVELTLEETFTRCFTRAMHLPHMSDRFVRFEESLGRMRWKGRAGQQGARRAGGGWN